jgi:transcriptional regulator with XRE-family HTH domain
MEVLRMGLKDNIISFRKDISKHFQADLAKERNVLGRKIGEARKKEGLTQGELSELLSHFGVNVKTPAVNKWEKGETVPNAYQLVALCHALNIEGGLDFFTGPVVPKKEVLNAQGLRMLNNYREFLESNPRYTINYHVAMIEMPVSLLPASAGYGDFLDDETMETREFPASSVPEGADFAVPVDGDSMEPLYHDGQLAWIQLMPYLNVGDVGLFIVDGHGYIKTYDEREPDEDEYEEFIDSDGVLHPQVVLISQNKEYQPKIIKPDMDFRVVGRVLN